MKDSGLQRFVRLLLAVGLLTWVAYGQPAAAASEEIIPVLKTKAGTYTNVTITARTETELCILHDGGMGNVFFEDLEPEAYAVVDYVPPTPTGDKLKAIATEHAAKVVEALQGTSGGSDGLSSVPPPLPELDSGVLLIVGAIGFVFYVFFSYCYMLICKKTGEEPGILIWIPLLQIFPLFRAAGMSGWYVLGMFLPILNLIIPIMWCFKIVSARGKSPLWAVLMILPLTNFIAFLYLAFSSGVDAEPEASTPTRIGGLAVRPV